jgi:hypothetical protein
VQEERSRNDLSQQCPAASAVWNTVTLQWFRGESWDGMHGNSSAANAIDSVGE